MIYISFAVAAKVNVPPGAIFEAVDPSVTAIEGPESLPLAILPANIALVTPEAFTRIASLLVSIELSSTFIAKTWEDKANPSPATADFSLKPLESSIAEVLAS